MEVKLIKPWSYRRNGYELIEFKAGLVQMDEHAAKLAEQCGVVETKTDAKKPGSKKKSEEK